MMGPIIEARKFDDKFISAKVPTPYHLAPIGKSSELPEEVWVNIYARVDMGRIVSNHYFEVCTPQQSYQAKAQQAWKACMHKSRHSSIRNVYFKP
jgi:hypothetical protein